MGCCLVGRRYQLGQFEGDHSWDSGIEGDLCYQFLMAVRAVRGRRLFDGEQV